jgi:hypothetical protein
VTQSRQITAGITLGERNEVVEFSGIEWQRTSFIITTRRRGRRRRWNRRMTSGLLFLQQMSDE